MNEAQRLARLWMVYKGIDMALSAGESLPYWWNGAIISADQILMLRKMQTDTKREIDELQRKLWEQEQGVMQP